MRETWHEHYIRLLLPAEMKEKCTVSLSISFFLDMIQNHLMKVYGERADWERNLRKYYDSEEHLSQCLTVKTIDDIPELTIDDIKDWISSEKRFATSINHLLELLPLIEGNNKKIETVEALVEACSLLGLTEPNSDSIYHWIIDWEGITKDEHARLRDNMLAYPAELICVVSTLIKLCFNGRLVTYPVLETVMTQQKTRYFYRGENAYYGSCKPSAFRWAGSSKPEWLVQRVKETLIKMGLNSPEGVE